MIAGAAVPTCEPRVRAELDHAKRHDRAGESVSMPSSADERIDVACEILLGENRQAKQKKHGNRIYEMFQDRQDLNPANPDTSC